jgi:hypothetical protein
MDAGFFNMCFYCFASVNRPSVNGPEQLLVPVYVPEIVELETPVALPSIVALQSANPDIPPAGTVMVNVNDAPLRVPARLPLKMTIPREDLAVTGAVTAAADCDTVHVIVPAPLESEVEPEKVPLRVTGVVEPELPPEGALGPGLELPQAAHRAISAITSRE